MQRAKGLTQFVMVAMLALMCTACSQASVSAGWEEPVAVITTGQVAAMGPSAGIF